MRVGIVAGESSGDILGAEFIRAMRERVPGVSFEGVAGPRMVEAGCEALFPVEALSVMGLAEVLLHLPRLLRLRAQLLRHFTANPPDLFIGIDAPDFNLGMERRLRKAGIATVHYVSPSIWAWRPGRVHKVGEAADLVLALLPFEPALYEKHGIKAVFVGHPLAGRLHPTEDRDELRRSLHLAGQEPLIALLPGSRVTEVERLGPLFLETAQWLSHELPHARFVIPAATAALGRAIKDQVRRLKPDLPVTVVDGHSHEVMAASDAALVASGTVTLEAMLLGCPMVVSYRLAGISYALIRGCNLLKIPYVSLPNLLAGREVVPEFLQYDALPERMGQALLSILQNGQVRRAQQDAFRELSAALELDASARAADAVLSMLAARPGS